VARVADLYGVSVSSLYRRLRELHRPKGLRRADRGSPRALPRAELERYCEIVAALKVRTENGKGHKLSTVRAIELLEEHGVDIPDGHVQVPPGLLAATTVNRWLRTWGYDHARMTRPPPAVRFEAHHANELWHFDMSPSDLKQLPQPAWTGQAETIQAFLDELTSSADTDTFVRQQLEAPYGVRRLTPRA
jgi:hypothetical protein